MTERIPGSATEALRLYSDEILHSLESVSNTIGSPIILKLRSLLNPPKDNLSITITGPYQELDFRAVGSGVKHYDSDPNQATAKKLWETHITSSTDGNGAYYLRVEDDEHSQGKEYKPPKIITEIIDTNDEITISTLGPIDQLVPNASDIERAGWGLNEKLYTQNQQNLIQETRLENIAPYPAFLQTVTVINKHDFSSKTYIQVKFMISKRQGMSLTKNFMAILEKVLKSNESKPIIKEVSSWKKGGIRMIDTPSETPRSWLIIKEDDLYQSNIPKL